MSKANSWRPKNWETINPKPIGTSLGYAFNREAMYKHGEDCADAMLKAPSKQEEPTYGIINPPETRTTYILAFPFYKRVWRLLMLLIKGWCYFD